MVAQRWAKGVVCPTCGSAKVSYLEKQSKWQCSSHHPKRQFTLKTGTIFEDSPLGLDKWLPAVWMIVNAKNGIPSWELHRALGVTQKTAWFMLHRIRLAMQDDLTGGALSGQVEVDETFIGGKARNMHLHEPRRKALKGGGASGKAIVFGMLERGGKVQATVVPDRKKNTIRSEVRANIAEGSEIYSDEHAGTWRMDDEYVHGTVSHLEKYVEGNIHTNGLENCWSLLKRGINGTYVSVEPFHLFRYVDEQAFRYNNRGNALADPGRFRTAMRQIVGRRLTDKELTGKEAETAAR